MCGYFLEVQVDSVSIRLYLSREYLRGFYLQSCPLTNQAINWIVFQLKIFAAVYNHRCTGGPACNEKVKAKGSIARDQEIIKFVNGQIIIYFSSYLYPPE